MTSSTAPVALVTGAAKRIGKAIASGLHAEGYTVCLHYYQSKEETEALVAFFNEVRPHSAMAIQADLNLTRVRADAQLPSLPARCTSLVEACYESWGRCDVLVNNASAYYPTPLVSTEDTNEGVEEAAADIFGSNAIAPYYLIKAFAKKATAVPTEDGYRVINMVDSMTKQPLLGFAGYTMAKGALESLTQAAALELAPHGIRVNGVGPGLSVLPRNMAPEIQEEYRRKVPLGQRESKAEEIADVVVFLASKKAQYITGAFLNVDGGWSLTRA